MVDGLNTARLPWYRYGLPIGRCTSKSDPMETASRWTNRFPQLKGL